MSVLASELQLFSAANIPTDDTSTAGGARSTTSRPTLDQFTASAKVALISDGADTRNVDITGRLADGSIATETVALTNAVEVLSVNTYERVLKIAAQTTDAARTITVKQGTGGTTRATILPNETTRHIAFQRAFSAASAKTYYEKHFWLNSNATLALTTAAVKLTADPSSLIRIGCAPSKGDSATQANRLTTPTSVTFVDDNVSQSVPGGSLGAGEEIGIYAELALASNNAAVKSSYTVQLSGQTT